MITRMEVESTLPGVPALPLGGFMPNDDPVQIRNIEGLGPVKSEVASTPFATGRGDLYQGSSTGKRNIVLTLGLNPNWLDQSAASLRQLLYRYFMPENWAKFKFFTDDLPDVYINGVVESFEPNIFSEDPEIQISIICPKPDFIDVDTTLVRGSTDSTAYIPIDYVGTVPSGLELRIRSRFDTYFGDVVIANYIGSFNQYILVRDVLINPVAYFTLNSVRTTRHLYNVFTDSTSVNLLEKLGPGPVWPEFHPGTNMFYASTGSFYTGDLGLELSVGYFNRFGGL